MLCGLKTILTDMNILNSYRHIRPKKVKYPIPEIPDDSGKKSGMDRVLLKIIGSGRVSGTRQSLVISKIRFQNIVIIILATNQVSVLERMDEGLKVLECLLPVYFKVQIIVIIIIVSCLPTFRSKSSSLSSTLSSSSSSSSLSSSSPASLL